jgi:hypothetical protein
MADAKVLNKSRYKIVTGPGYPPPGPLSTEERKALPDSEFAIPSKRAYPIHDLNHARNAISRVSQNGTDKEKEAVRKAVYKRYPQLIPVGMIGVYTTGLPYKSKSVAGKSALVRYIQHETVTGNKVKVTPLYIDSSGTPHYIAVSYAHIDKKLPVREAVRANLMQMVNRQGNKIKPGHPVLKAPQTAHNRQHGVDLGAGVVREGRRQHIK